MQIEELKAITKLDDIAFGEVYALSKLDKNAGVKKEAKRALERTRPADFAAMKAVFRGALGKDTSFSKKIATITLGESVLVAVAKGAMGLTEQGVRHNKLGFEYLCSQGGEAATFALQSIVSSEGKLILLGLRGAVPEELSQVKGIRSLEFIGNKLTDFPEVLYKIPGLESLMLFENKIGQLEDKFVKLRSLTCLKIRMPLKEGLGALPALKRLEINIVPNISDFFLSSLEELVIHSGDHQKIPSEIGVMKKLKTLRWSGRVTEIDDALWTLSHLEKLGLRGLKMRSLPEGIAKLKKLRTLDLGRVRMKTLPENFGELRHLEELNFSFAELLRTLPESFYQMPLKRLCIEYSPLEKRQEDIEKRMPNVEIYKGSHIMF